MIIKRGAVFTLVILTVFFTHFHAYADSTNDENHLRTAIIDYKIALENGDVQSIMKTIPPQIIKKLAEQSKIAQEQFNQIMISQLEQLSTMYKINKTNIDFDKRRSGKFTDGTLYYIMPLEFNITMPNAIKSHVTGDLVAIQENTHWYFVRGDDQSTLQFMNETFPGFEKIELNASKAQRIE
ncbi:hypothetical protein [Bartonella tamiae]|uniref:Uncharacterized protein n=1 Tax=Bartonella tamiae Th239 TaxID=1094558 RepID=J0QSX8_9HYPH|nr:hypothetical protein [Bartonella tamiae]EJF88951.1 hypothetical protein ME5_01502 [Bartonella tamiae Th239]EJF94799.1 hypothetical protein MEG_00380 [Bartonella tamiae Th307]